MRTIVLALVLMSAPTVAMANGPLRSIVVFGNEKTERETILDIVGVPPQTYVNPRLIQEVDDRLNNCGLFKKVAVSQVANPDGTADLRIQVVEKQLWFAFPMFQAWSSRYSGGAVFGESNLFVPNGRTIFLAQGGNEMSRFFSAFDAKNIFETHAAMRTWILARTDDVPLYDTGGVPIDQINMKDAAIAVIPGYQWTNEIRTSFKFLYRYVDYGQSALVPASGSNGSDVSLEFQFAYDSLRRREAFLKGSLVSATFEFADERFGTDFTYQIEDVKGILAYQVLKYFNYVVTLEGAIGRELPFHRDLTLGGASLRGYEDRQFRGDTLISTKQDLLFSIYRFRKLSFFGLAFHDLGLLYTDDLGISRKALRNGVGGGLRVSLADILAPVFGLDFGYGIEDKDFRLYFALGLVEF
ncbi:MAG TPA: BamA/TamA family outer membrane protein [Bdellovibrionota bacterium]|nr:BamA/TamA family outer membrane protein [Bdellovibrionota bacterium]